MIETKLTLVKELPKKHSRRIGLFKCVCGKEKVVRIDFFEKRKVRSCGCLNLRDPIDLSGNTYSYLTVIEICGRTSGSSRSRPLWKCICKCGKETTATSSQLVSGKKKSCGCKKIESAKENGKSNRIALPLSAFTHIWHSYLGRAKKKGLLFELSKEQIQELIHQPCTYCGRLNINTYYNPTQRSEYKYNGIDRKDVTKGYTIENTVPCCKVCNYMKLEMSVEQFLEHINAIYHFNKAIRDYE